MSHFSGVGADASGAASAYNVLCKSTSRQPPEDRDAFWSLLETIKKEKSDRDESSESVDIILSTRGKPNENQAFSSLAGRYHIDPKSSEAQRLLETPDSNLSNEEKGKKLSLLAALILKSSPVQRGPRVHTPHRRTMYTPPTTGARFAGGRASVRVPRGREHRYRHRHASSGSVHASSARRTQAPRDAHPSHGRQKRRTAAPRRRQQPPRTVHKRPVTSLRRRG